MNEASTDSIAVQLSPDVHRATSDAADRVASEAMPSWPSYDTRLPASCKGEAAPSSCPSPRSEYYRLMYACLQEKYDYVQSSTDRLRDRLYHVKKEVTYLKRMKRVLIRRLARYGESYSYAPLEIPDNMDTEDPAMKKRKERRERERERKEALRAAKKMQKNAKENEPYPIESVVQSADGKGPLSFGMNQSGQG
ncbi:hypothetical protein KIN20_010300 [Parelaphostrongylus tenuis]|uniref:Uncharacterized protein n=1 Tax=Parelaphostrongylus tenuis TaxID=148309 RepID=A0AAD5QLS2_PARTN|nr:hypothetical protein KIN20_010300 [Parelaphostrongylus tenuis]